MSKLPDIVFGVDVSALEENNLRSEAAKRVDDVLRAEAQAVAARHWQDLQSALTSTSGSDDWHTTNDEWCSFTAKAVKRHLDQVTEEDRKQVEDLIFNGFKRARENIDE